VALSTWRTWTSTPMRLACSANTSAEVTAARPVATSSTLQLLVAGLRSNAPPAPRRGARGNAVVEGRVERCVQVVGHRPWPFSARRTSSSRSASRRNAWRTRGSSNGALAVFMSNDSQLLLTDFSRRSRGSACSTAGARWP
jgi:hypothetical protein